MRRQTALLSGPALGLAFVLGAALPAAAQSPAAAQIVSADQCGELKAPPGAWIAACSQIIDGGQVLGPDLAKAYAHRGHAFTVLRNLPRSGEDLNNAIKLDPAQIGRAHV